MTSNWSIVHQLQNWCHHTPSHRDTSISMPLLLLLLLLFVSLQLTSFCSYSQFHSIPKVPLLSPNKQSQNTEGNSNYWLQPGKINHWPHLFLIHQMNPEGRHFTQRLIQPMCYICTLTDTIFVLLNVSKYHQLPLLIRVWARVNRPLTAVMCRGVFPSCVYYNAHI